MSLRQKSKLLTGCCAQSWPWVHDPHLEYILKWVPELREALALGVDRRCILEPWRLAVGGYTRGKVIDVTPRRDSPFWVMSVNRVHWPEYQQMMSGKAYCVIFKPETRDCLDKTRCDYPAPLVAPVEIEVFPERIPVDNSWGTPGATGRNVKHVIRGRAAAHNAHGKGDVPTTRVGTIASSSAAIDTQTHLRRGEASKTKRGSGRRGSRNRVGRVQ